MRIKKLLAALMAVLVLGSNMAVCFAAATEPDDGAPAEVSEAADSTDAPDNGATAFPDGLTVDENGNFTLPSGAWESLLAELLSGNASGTGEDDNEPAEVVITTGTVNVKSGSYLHLRTGPGMDYQIIGHLLRGTKVEVIDTDGDWIQVTVPEATGYVHKNYLTLAEQTVPVYAPETGQQLDENTLLMLFLLMMNGMTGSSGSTPDGSTAEPPSLGLTPDGNMTLVDDYAQTNEDGSGKQFITLTTKAGNVFYLIIDRDDEGGENVHFLNLVDERDLLSLMDEAEAAEYTKPATEQPKPSEQTPSETEDPGEKEKPEEAAEKPAAKVNLVPIVVLVLVLLGGGGYFAYTKLFKGKAPKKQDRPDPDADYSEDDDYFDLPEDADVEDDGEDEEPYDAEDDEPV